MKQPIDRLRRTYAGGISGGSGGLEWCFQKLESETTWPCWFTDAFGNKVEVRGATFHFFQNAREMTTLIQELRQVLLERNYKENK